MDISIYYSHQNLHHSLTKAGMEFRASQTSKQTLSKETNTYHL